MSSSTAVINLKENLEAKEFELKSKLLIESQKEQKIEALKLKLKSEQEKSRRLGLELSGRDSQYKHEKKKLQQEIDRLLNKLHKLLQVCRCC